MLLCSDGLWDVISANRAAQLVLEVTHRSASTSWLLSRGVLIFYLIFQGKQKYSEQKTSADKVAHHVLSEARKLRTKDNTSVIFVDLDTLRSDP